VRIESVDNGWILHGEETIVVEDTGPHAKARLMWEVATMLDVRSSKHDLLRLDIRMIDQDGNEVEDA